MPPKRVSQNLRTPKKNMIRGAAAFCAQKGIKFTKSDLIRVFQVTRHQVDYALESDTGRTKHLSELKAHNHRKLTERDLDRVELFIKSNGYKGGALSWDELNQHFEFDVHPITLRERMRERLIFTFVAVAKPYLDAKLAAHRVQWATNMLRTYPHPSDWRHVRFSDEVHFGWGPEGRQLIIRPKGRQWRAHPSRIQRKETRDRKNADDSKRVHYWGAVGYNFKSPLIRYEVPGNTNGKMSQQVYIESILEPVVAEWCLENRPWCLEEDNDSGHGLRSRNNPVYRWKESHGMSTNSSTIHTYYANCRHSPDFAIIEDTWQYPKQYVRKRPHWNDELVDELVQEAWDQIPQDWINRLVDSMPTRLQDCIQSKGQLVEMRE